jgi:hypothetical protein
MPQISDYEFSRLKVDLRSLLLQAVHLRSQPFSEADHRSNHIHGVITGIVERVNAMGGTPQQQAPSAPFDVESKFKIGACYTTRCGKVAKIHRKSVLVIPAGVVILKGTIVDSGKECEWTLDGKSGEVYPASWKLVGPELDLTHDGEHFAR